MSQRYLTLKQAAGKLNRSSKALAQFLQANPQSPPLFAKPGRGYLISEDDLERIYDAMKVATNRQQQPKQTERSPSERQIYESLRKLTSAPKSTSKRQKRN